MRLLMSCCLVKTGLIVFERTMSEKLELPFYPAATQTYTRKQDLNVLNTLGQPGGDTL